MTKEDGPPGQDVTQKLHFLIAPASILLTSFLAYIPPITPCFIGSCYLASIKLWGFAR